METFRAVFDSVINIVLEIHKPTEIYCKIKQLDTKVMIRLKIGFHYYPLKVTLKIRLELFSHYFEQNEVIQRRIQNAVKHLRGSLFRNQETAFSYLFSQKASCQMFASEISRKIFSHDTRQKRSAGYVPRNYCFKSFQKMHLQWGKRSPAQIFSCVGVTILLSMYGQMLLTYGRNCDLNKFFGSHLRLALVFMWSGGRRSISIFYKFLLVLVKFCVLGGGQGTMLKFYEVLKFSCFLIS